MIFYNTNISKKKTILMRLTCFAFDTIGFLLIYLFLNSETFDNDQLEVTILFKFMIVFIVIFSIVGGYSRASLFSVSRNFKLIAVTTISMPFTFNLFLYVTDSTTIINQAFIDLLYISFCVI